MPVTPNTLTVLVPTIIASLQRVLRNSGAILNAVTTDASTEPAGLNQTINLPGTAAQAGYDVTPGATPPALVGTVPTTKTLTIDKYRGSRFSLTGEDWKSLANRGPDLRMTQIDECISTLVDEVTAYVWGKFDLGAGYAIGTAGTNPFATNPNILMDGWQLQSDLKVPNMGRMAVVGTLDWAAAGKLAQFQKLNEAPEGVQFNLAQLAMLANYRMTWDQAITNHTAGTGTGYLINEVAGYAIGTTVLTVDTGAGTILPGDVVAIGSFKYVVASFAGGVTLTLNSGLLAAVANNDAITLSLTHRTSVLVHPDSHVLALRPPAEAPEGDAATEVTVIRDPVTGVAMRLAHYKGYHAGQWELSLVWGSAIRRPNLALKLLG